jgi:hypothetical protein
MPEVVKTKVTEPGFPEHGAEVRLEQLAKAQRLVESAGN